MRYTQYIQGSKRQHLQRGAALVISLILLVIMTLIGLAGIRSVTQQERMANHSFDRSLAFQATEAALREIELLVEAKKPAPTAGCSVVDNLMSCAAPANDAAPRWLDDTFASWTNATVVGSGALNMTPQYFVEYLGPNFECQPGIGTGSESCKRYRITARSNDSTASRSYVMLQSIYATE